MSAARLDDVTFGQGHDRQVMQLTLSLHAEMSQGRQAPLSAAIACEVPYACSCMKMGARRGDVRAPYESLRPFGGTAANSNSACLRRLFQLGVRRQVCPARWHAVAQLIEGVPTNLAQRFPR